MYYYKEYPKAPTPSTADEDPDVHSMCQKLPVACVWHMGHKWWRWHKDGEDWDDVDGQISGELRSVGIEVHVKSENILKCMS